MDSLKGQLLELLSRDDLLQASLLLGKIENPNLKTEPWVETVLYLASRTWHRTVTVRKDPVLVIERVNEVLFSEFKIVGRSERSKQVIDDPKQFFMHHILDGKAGSSLTVTILYLILLQQIGFESECLAFPSGFLIRIQDLDSEFYVDAYDSGKILTSNDFQRKLRNGIQKHRLNFGNLFERINAFHLVSRLIHNLKHAFILKGDALSALRTVELLTALFPRSPEITRDRGILYCEMEYFSKAMEDLKYYLRKRPNAEDISEIRKLTSMLRGYRETMN